MIENYRAEFLDTLQDLCDVAENYHDISKAIWKAEYLTRSGRWYHYFGIAREHDRSAVGYEHDLQTDMTRDADPFTLIFTFLDFATNEAISTYSGDHGSAADIKEEVLAICGAVPEIVRIGIETREQLPCGRSVMTVTDAVFIGFDASAGEMKNLSTKSQVSRKWCRGRRYYGASEQLARI